MKCCGNCAVCELDVNKQACCAIQTLKNIIEVKGLLVELRSLLSVKDTEDPQTHAPIVATAEMLNAANGKSRLGCTVAAKFSRQFSDEVSWQKVDPQAAAAASGEEDITEGGDNQGGGNNNNPPSGELEG